MSMRAETIEQRKFQKMTELLPLITGKTWTKAVKLISQKLGVKERQAANIFSDFRKFEKEHALENQDIQRNEQINIALQFYRYLSFKVAQLIEAEKNTQVEINLDLLREWFRQWIESARFVAQLTGAYFEMYQKLPAQEINVTGVQTTAALNVSEIVQFVNDELKHREAMKAKDKDKMKKPGKRSDEIKLLAMGGNLPDVEIDPELLQPDEIDVIDPTTTLKQ